MCSSDLSIDYETIDVIMIMYDGSDYLDGRLVADLNKPTDIQTFIGNLDASLELLQNTYPYARIIVMSPTYAFAINEDGDYVSSDIYVYNEYTLSTYAIMIDRATYNRGITFVDNIYGTINEDNASDYLLDHIKLNLAGRDLVADRFLYALNYYNRATE